MTKQAGTTVSVYKTFVKKSCSLSLCYLAVSTDNKIKSKCVSLAFKGQSTHPTLASTPLKARQCPSASWQSIRLYAMRKQPGYKADMGPSHTTARYCPWNKPIHPPASQLNMKAHYCLFFLVPTLPCAHIKYQPGFQRFMEPPLPGMSFSILYCSWT